jgi:hypothetical protein
VAHGIVNKEIVRLKFIPPVHSKRNTFVLTRPDLFSWSIIILIESCVLVSIFSHWFSRFLLKVNITFSLARERATKKAHRSSSGCFLKFQKAWSSRPTKITVWYSSPLLLWMVMIGIVALPVIRSRAPIHALLDQYRVSSNREFFVLLLERAIEAILPIVKEINETQSWRLSILLSFFAASAASLRPVKILVAPVVMALTSGWHNRRIRNIKISALSPYFNMHHWRIWRIRITRHQKFISKNQKTCNLNHVLPIHTWVFIRWSMAFLINLKKPTINHQPKSYRIAENIRIIFVTAEVG